MSDLKIERLEDLLDAERRMVRKLNEQLEAETARADGLQVENLELKRLMCEFQIHDSACDISDINDPTYFGECDCRLSKWEEELAALEGKP